MAESTPVATQNATQTASVDVAIDEIGGILYQRVKLSHGADGSATDTSSANPLPVTTVPGTNQTVNTTVSVDTTVGGTEVLAASATRKGFCLMSDTLFYVAVGGDPTSSSFPVQPYQVFSPPANLTGQVKCLSSSGTINVWVFAC